MARDWTAVAEAMKTRLTDLDMTQAELIHRSRLAPTTIREMLFNTTERRRSPQTLTALSRALGWPPGYLQAVAEGRSPGNPAADTPLPGEGGLPDGRGSASPARAPAGSPLSAERDEDPPPPGRPGDRLPAPDPAQVMTLAEVSDILRQLTGLQKLTVSLEERIVAAAIHLSGRLTRMERRLDDLAGNGPAGPEPAAGNLRESRPPRPPPRRPDAPTDLTRTSTAGRTTPIFRLLRLRADPSERGTGSRCHPRRNGVSPN
jgi:hypothetical protein